MRPSASPALATTARRKRSAPTPSHVASATPPPAKKRAKAKKVRATGGGSGPKVPKLHRARLAEDCRTAQALQEDLETGRALAALAPCVFAVAKACTAAAGFPGRQSDLPFELVHVAGAGGGGGGGNDNGSGNGNGDYELTVLEAFDEGRGGTSSAGSTLYRRLKQTPGHPGHATVAAAGRPGGPPSFAPMRMGPLLGADGVSPHELLRQHFFAFAVPDAAFFAGGQLFDLTAARRGEIDAANEAHYGPRRLLSCARLHFLPASWSEEVLATRRANHCRHAPKAV